MAASMRRNASHSFLHNRQAAIVTFLLSRQKSGDNLYWRKHRAEKKRTQRDDKGEERFLRQYLRFDYLYTRRQNSRWPNFPDRGKIVDPVRKQLRNREAVPEYMEDRMMSITSSAEVVDPYKPPGDGKASWIAMKRKPLEMVEDAKSFGRTKRAVANIRKYEGSFSAEPFASSCKDLYMEVLTLLQNVRDHRARLHQLCTDLAFPSLTNTLKRRTLRWKYIEDVEPPQMIRARTFEALTKSNIFAQVTVRMHTKQIFALYDQFGRLMYGHESIPKDTLEYVVFEKQISNMYGVWRVHEKLHPSGEPHHDPVINTYLMDRPDEEPVRISVRPMISREEAQEKEEAESK